jgi:hypothetical protein
LVKAKTSKPVTSVEKRCTPNVSFDPFFFLFGLFLFNYRRGFIVAEMKKEEHASDKKPEQHKDIMMGKKQ